MIDSVLMLGAVGVLLGVAEAVNPEAIGRRDRGHLVGAGSAHKIGLKTDLGWMVLWLVYMPVLGSTIAGICAVASHSSPLHAPVASGRWWLQLGIAVALTDAAAYGVHRLSHRIPWLWRIHSVHHSSHHLRWWSTFRFHPVDAAISHGLPLVVAAALGAPPAALALYLSLVTVTTLLAHADVFVPGHMLHRAIVTPTFHRSHHEVGHEAHNFAVVLPVWDILFRTASFTVGVRRFGSSAPVPEGFISQLMWGFRTHDSPKERNAEHERSQVHRRTDDASRSQPGASPDQHGGLANHHGGLRGHQGEGRIGQGFQRRKQNKEGNRV